MRSCKRARVLPIIHVWDDWTMNNLLRDLHATDDLLGRNSALATLNHAIKHVVPPACIALYGSWGAGKTSLLRLAEKQKAWSSKPEMARAIWFDTWEHDQRGDVVSPLLWTIAGKAREWNKGGNMENKILRAAASVGKLALSLTARAGLAWLGAKGKNTSLEKMSEWKLEDIKKYFDDSKAFHNEVEEAKAQFKELVTLALGKTDPDSRLVVFLDDLDRCLPDSVVTLLEAIKLFLCSGNHDAPVVFVFGLDRTIVGEAIARRYPGSSLYTGESYLEKIFDVSLEVPPVSVNDLGKFLEKQWETTKLDEDLSFVGGAAALKEVLLLPAFANPRVIKRCLNRLLLLKAAPGAADATTALLKGVREDQGRLLLWAAGAERFRGFRYAFMEASSAEIKGFHATCMGNADVTQARLGDGLRRVIGTPSFLEFYFRLVGKSANHEQVDMLRIRSDQNSKIGRPTFGDIDAHLRSYGV
jgi:hypothetical protein